jgi:hypothetical protein
MTGRSTPDLNSPMITKSKNHQMVSNPKSTFFDPNSSISSKSISLKKDDKMSFAVDYDLRNNTKKKETKITKMEHAEKIIVRMLDKIIEFWRRNSKYVSKRGLFPESQLKTI